MFKITRNESTNQLMITVQTNDAAEFEAVPLHPKERTVNLNQMVVHCPGYEIESVPDATGLYVFYERNSQLMYHHFD